MKAHEERTGRVEPRAPDAAAAARAVRFGRLPTRILPERMVEEIPADPPNDPLFGRNPDNDWLVRYSL